MGSKPAWFTIPAEEEMGHGDPPQPESPRPRQTYQFDPQHEFSGADNSLSYFESVATPFTNESNEPFFEIPLRVFENWCFDYGFCTQLLRRKQLSSNRCTHRVWFLCPALFPKSDAARKQFIKNDLATAKQLALQFYSIVFYHPDKNPEAFEFDCKAQEHAVTNDYTIMIVATIVTRTTQASRMLLNTHKVEDIRVISAVTYRPTAYQEPDGIHNMIMWLATSQECWSDKVTTTCRGRDDLSLPSKKVTSWRRLDFARFLILTIIKDCAAISPSKGMETDTKITLYVQCTQDIALQFYQNVGFTTLMDDPKNDGFTLLPQILQKALSKDLCHSFMLYQNVGDLKCGSIEEVP